MTKKVVLSMLGIVLLIGIFTLKRSNKDLGFGPRGSDQALPQNSPAVTRGGHSGIASGGAPDSMPAEPTSVTPFNPDSEFNRIATLPESSRQVAKNAYFTNLMQHFAQHPDVLPAARDYVLALPRETAEYDDKITLIISAMGNQGSAAADAVLRELLAQATPDQEIITFQSAISLGSHLVPSLASISTLWNAYQMESLSIETRSAALAAMGAAASHWPADQTGDVVEKLQALSLSPSRQLASIALSAMGNHGHAGYEEGLRNLLKETNDPYLRSEAILTLAKVAPKAALDTLVELAISEPSADARLSAARSLELLEPSEAALEKVRAVYSRSDDRSVREALLTALARLGRDALPLLASSLDDLARGETDEHLRSLAASYARSAQQSR